MIGSQQRSSAPPHFSKQFTVGRSSLGSREPRTGGGGSRVRDHSWSEGGPRHPLSPVYPVCHPEPGSYTGCPAPSTGSTLSEPRAIQGVPTWDTLYSTQWMFRTPEYPLAPSAQVFYMVFRASTGTMSQGALAIVEGVPGILQCVSGINRVSWIYTGHLILKIYTFHTEWATKSDLTENRLNHPLALLTPVKFMFGNKDWKCCTNCVEISESSN